MGYSPVEAIGQGWVEIGIGSFENLLHLPNIYVNILFVYQITHTSTRRRV